MTARVLKAAWSRAMKMTAVLKDRHHSIVVITMSVALDRALKEPHAAERSSAAFVWGSVSPRQTAESP